MHSSEKVCFEQKSYGT